MSYSWNEGYATDTDYIYQYFNELNPLQSKLLLLAKGIAAPKIKNACELGFGQGLSINFHAISSDINWYGTDFMPTQTSFAKNMAQQAQNKNIHLFDDSFAEFAKRDDLPQFDYIALHGIWTWISDENRRILVDFIHKKLNVGGLLYISYNTLPGHNKTAPLRELLSMYSKTCLAPNMEVNTKIDNALTFAKKVFSNSKIHCSDNPHVLSKLETLEKQDHTYLEHEYCNENWEPMYFSEMAKWLDPAKLSFVCSATPFENLDRINFNEEHNELLNSVNNIVMRETIKDFIFNQQFRRDLWIKGPLRYNEIDKQKALEDLHCILVSPKNKINGNVQCLLGEANLSDIYAPILQVLGDNKPHSIVEITHKTQQFGFVFNHTITALIALYAQNHLLIVQEPCDNIITHAKNINEYLLKNALYDPKVLSLACPLTGGAFNFDNVQFMMLYAAKMLGEQVTIQKLIDFVWEVLSTKGHQIVNSGKLIETEEEHKKILKEEALNFFERLSLYYTLKIL